MDAFKLKEILEQHQLWDQTNGVQGNRANLTGADLTDANLTGANLTDANLRYADLKGADLTGANLTGANLTGANLTDANLRVTTLTGANLGGADLTSADLASADLEDTIGLPDVSWIIPGCLAQLNKIVFGFYLEKEGKSANFIQDSFGLIIQNNGEENSFDMLIEDSIIRSIPDWVKYSGLKQIESV